MSLNNESAIESIFKQHDVQLLTLVSRSGTTGFVADWLQTVPRQGGVLFVPLTNCQ